MGKKQILLLGDSIRMGYGGYVRDVLQETAEVIWPEDNCRSSFNIIDCLNMWRGLCRTEDVAAVHFNCGHWDAAFYPEDNAPITTLEQYEYNIGRIIHRLKIYFPNARIIYATTTPMNSTRPSNHTTEMLRAYNRVGIRAAQENGAMIDDLFAVAEDWTPEMFLDDCHFVEEGYRILGITVAELVKYSL